MIKIELRKAQAADIPALSAIADATELFPGDMLPDMISGALQGDAQDIWLTGLQDGVPVGFCFARPEDLTDRVWNMLALAVSPLAQRGGVGQRLVKTLEDMLRADGQRLLIVDTSGSDAFQHARKFYEACGYDQEARLRDYWADGDDKVTFRKRLS